MSEETLEMIVNVEKVVAQHIKRIAELEKRVAELEAKVNQVHPDYCNCGKCEKVKML